MKLVLFLASALLVAVEVTSRQIYNFFSSVTLSEINGKSLATLSWKKNEEALEVGDVIWFKPGCVKGVGTLELKGGGNFEASCEKRGKDSTTNVYCTVKKSGIVGGGSVEVVMAPYCECSRYSWFQKNGYETSPYTPILLFGEWTSCGPEGKIIDNFFQNVTLSDVERNSFVELKWAPTQELDVGDVIDFSTNCLETGKPFDLRDGEISWAHCKASSGHKYNLVTCTVTTKGKFNTGSAKASVEPDCNCVAQETPTWSQFGDGVPWKSKIKSIGAWPKCLPFRIPQQGLSLPFSDNERPPRFYSNDDENLQSLPDFILPKDHKTSAKSKHGPTLSEIDVPTKDTIPLTQGYLPPLEYLPSLEYLPPTEPSPPKI